MPAAAPPLKVVISVHLGAACGKQRLLATAARHRVGSEVTDKWPGVEHCWVVGLYGVDIDQSDQTFGCGLDNSAGDGSRGGRSSLTC